MAVPEPIGQSHTKPISVVGDATYCIPGPICVGAHDYPAGKNCPKKGDVAGQDCVGGIPSYSNGQCVLTTDAVCQQMNDGVWGCMLPEAAPMAPTSNSSTTVKMAVAASTDLSPPDYTGYFVAGGTVAAVAAVAMAVLIVKKHNAETPVL
ncbi:hypothetical protein SPRG_00603 [Saprolegnia parasitica CBS 223.65]|uniref:Uncharacterized protein n=1 Tax=Saprolegnia parasitica (strain CBS 223.65) TaxID=695850 RepID=A0A067CZ44_SAPPC|nr:hypothetical protein SPRG_00603 [Saprolegnia parasitica CBS 223.65]KDO34540.1 hypothetical protein SPRG_00603 [Saprolegnia parasitica CBS 223.65]|eukprot:XP_012194218.1 hypothetical protein SPRG_00603 [Saprolegnia parasitica CBS 223.65]